MRENIDIIGIFHDGSVVEIDGSLPNISIRIEIEYLRKMFPSDGNSFWAKLTDCTFFEFLNWDTDERISDLNNIEKEEPEILSVEQKKDIAHIICSTGELDIKYSNIEFKLDNGTPVSYEELAHACNKYWDDWESRTRS